MNLVNQIEIPLEDDGTIEEDLIDFIPIPEGKTKISTTVEERLGLSIDDIFDIIDEDEGMKDGKVTGQEVLNFIDTTNQLHGDTTSNSDKSIYETAIRAITGAHADTPIGEIKLDETQFKTVLAFVDAHLPGNQFNFTDKEFRENTEYTPKDASNEQYIATSDLGEYGTFTWEWNGDTNTPTNTNDGTNDFSTLTWMPLTET